jgi:hypothetical protein
MMQGFKPDDDFTFSRLDPQGVDWTTDAHKNNHAQRGIKREATESPPLDSSSSSARPSNTGKRRVKKEESP